MSSIENPEEQTIQSMDLPNDSSEWPEGFMTYDLKLRFIIYLLNQKCTDIEKY